MPIRSSFARSLSGALVLTALTATAQAAPTLVGWAKLDADTFSDGPTSGQFTGPQNTVAPPYANKQPVQGFSAVLHGPRKGTYRVMSDNGFGNKANSPDALLRMYAVKPDFRTSESGSGVVSPVGFFNGRPQTEFNARTRITLHDPARKLGFPLVADRDFYPYAGTGPGNAAIPVDPSIKKTRLLTGGDLDIEAVREDRWGNLWFGDEFGPFLVKTDRRGKVLSREIQLPLPKLAGNPDLGDNPFVQSPQNPYLGGKAANLRGSNGFEGMAINMAGTKLYTLLEGPLITDPDQKRLVIGEFDIRKQRYTGRTFAYKLEPMGTNIGDFTAINDREFLVIERNGSQGDPNLPATFPNPANFKRLYKVDFDQIDANGFVKKTEVVDLLNVADPNDLDGDGFSRFTFPFVTIEDVLIVDPKTLLVINDNNYPGNGGRTLTGPDATEFILVRLDDELDVPRRHREDDDEAEED